MIDMLLRAHEYTAAGDLSKQRHVTVIHYRNPLTVDPMTIKDIKVVETIKEGKTIYKAN